MARTAVLGLPRVGPNRELKFAMEAFWAGRSSIQELEATARELRRASWECAREAGIDVIPSGDFSLYDQMLDTAFGLGVAEGDYFAYARGTADRPPLEMTKWFDTNYHYLVPELRADQAFTLRADHWTGPLREAAELGIKTRPVVIGPYTFLTLAKGEKPPLEALVPVYRELLQALADAGATEVQLDEPCLALDGVPAAYADVFAALATAPIEICLATYFAPADPVVFALPAAEIHIDLVRAPEQLEAALASVTGRLSLGVIDGRNVWATDPDLALDRIDAAVAALGAGRVTIAPSCSLLHVPYSAARETEIDAEIRPWLAFRDEKLAELRLLADALAGDRDALLEPARDVISARRTSTHTNDAAVRGRVGALSPADYERSAPFEARHAAQRARVPLPELPTTTIGSFPQTAEIRAARREHKAGELDVEAYERFLKGQIAEVVSHQEAVGLDVLVHGEPERNDMVEYFGEQLAGFAFSRFGWVQSYGSRCVKPPILFGDVSRPEPMTVRWWQHAQSLTTKPMKGMLTGPVTILQWSFVRDDQPRSETCTQIALAIQDEVRDLEAAGCFAIQVDEAALREGLPLRHADQDVYVRWAVDAFRLTVATAEPDTQVHTHMCYSEFNEMMEHIVRLDADVISIEASRSDMEVLDAFAGELDYPNEIGPGLYDIHSPRIPSTDEIERLLELAEQRIPRERLWVNPDCGLKTRGWAEVRPALTNLVAAARRRRAAVRA
ncbi:5-methyltetrahydropteroyltriglutamate--homocysteine S-methyltransferase [Solirubrobacter phytolaccae]|uniref:5-methyltetrahydropteroyltriglutamate--homocysteine methyltransferase n=1 Tax=Solirubrobacter phytolaccae TaxID=1404360 RepID=A0A9X3SIW9_9ACTN|nr:5-methyltetrahydropteroyltriglutamate--homocysteine S-methyltransferase [Solirubrobacter phytolaccae]MDA0184637.1 5-methyltetrahydropteroyltriglutamate--homocysteine S-methyltransferase [Solirubrobacter phytolaccae]